MTVKELDRLSEMIANKVYAKLRRDMIGDTEEWLTTAQAAEYLQCSVGHLRRNILDVPHERVGGRYRFSKRSLSEYIRRG